MISSASPSSPIDTMNAIERFLTSNNVLFDVITEKELNAYNNSEVNTSITGTFTLSKPVRSAFEQKTNLLVLTQNEHNFLQELFFQICDVEPAFGKIVFLLPDTKTCERVKSVFQALNFKKEQLEITALETLPKNENETSYGNVLITSGPVLQSCITKSDTIPKLSQWLATVQLLILPNINYLSLSKKNLLFSLVEILHPGQLILSSANEHGITEVQQFILQLTGKTTSLIRFQQGRATKKYYPIIKDFTFAKRAELLRELLDLGYFTIIFTQSTIESNKLFYELEKNYFSPVEQIGTGHTGLPSELKEENAKVINLDNISLSKIKNKIIPYIMVHPCICIASKPIPDLKLTHKLITVIYAGLPKRINEFFRFEEPIRSSNTNAEKHIIVLGLNEYDRLVVTNKEVCMNYLTSPKQQYDYMPHTTLATLFTAVVHIRKNLPVQADAGRTLKALHLATEDEPTRRWELTALGKQFLRNYLLFKKKKYTIYYLDTNEQHPKHRMINIEDIDVLLYPGTIHFENQVLQKVTSFTQDAKGYRKPVFESLQDNKKLTRQYRNNDYRTFIEPELIFDEETVQEKGLALLNSTPKIFHTSYISKEEHPFTLVSKKEQIQGAPTTILFGQLLVVEFYEQPIDMAMVIHALIHALRIIYDVTFNTITYTITTKTIQLEKKVHEVVLIDRTISDLFKMLDIQQTLLVAKKVLSNYFKLNKITAENETEKEFAGLVIPLPQMRYHPTRNERFSYIRIQDCFNHVEEALQTFQQKQNRPNIQGRIPKEEHKPSPETINEQQTHATPSQHAGREEPKTLVIHEENKKQGTKYTPIPIQNLLQDVKTSDWGLLREKLKLKE